MVTLRRIGGFRSVAEVLQNPLNHRGFLDAGDHPQLPATSATGLNVNGEHPLAALRQVRDRCRSTADGSLDSIALPAAGADALNDTSIGIKIVNQSACIDNDLETPAPEIQTCRFLDYPEEQIEMLVSLASDILQRYPDIDPIDVIGHGDIAPDRRVDPGPLFPWKRLYDNGIGAWYDNQSVEAFRERFAAGPPEVGVIQRALQAYGYAIEESGENDVLTRFVVRAFQMHFRPEIATGVIDTETAAILFALLEKYRPDALVEILNDTDIGMSQMEIR